MVVDRSTIAQIASKGVRLHPAISALSRAAESGDERAKSYIDQLTDRDRARATLASRLSEVRELDQAEPYCVDAFDPSDIAEQARDAVRRAATPQELRQAREALAIVQRAEFVCASEGPNGLPGNRGAAGIAWRRERAAFSVGALTLGIPYSREAPAGWSLSPEKLAHRLRTCGSAWAVSLSADGTPIAAPLRCGVGLCPCCMASSGIQRMRVWQPMIEGLQAHGYTIAHLTATRPADYSAVAPVVATEWERGRFGPTLTRGGGRMATEADDFGTAVPGEPLAVALAELGEAWSAITHHDKTSREWWQRTTAGALLGTEYTGRGCRAREWGERCAGCVGRGPHARPWLRWHAHRHALIALRPGADIRWRSESYRLRSGEVRRRRVAAGGAWWDRWLSAWCQRTGASPAGQHLRFVGSGVDDIAGSLAETLKYPFKPAELTSAQAAEIVASTAGTHYHQAAGAWHGRSRWMIAAKSGNFSDLDSDDDRHLAVALADGLARRQLAETSCALLYRRVGPTEPRRPRRQMLPADSVDYANLDPAAWDDVQPNTGAEVAPVTVRWLADRVSRDSQASEELHEYQGGKWAAPRRFDLAALLAPLLAAS